MTKFLKIFSQIKYGEANDIKLKASAFVTININSIVWIKEGGRNTTEIGINCGNRLERHCIATPVYSFENTLRNAIENNMIFNM
jgi:hypothetical protein